MPEVIIIPSLFFMVGFIVWILVNSAQQRHRLRLWTDFHSKVIDRLGSVSDFTEFAKTEAGSKFLDGAIADAPRTRPGERVLRAAQLGIVQITLGGGLLALVDAFHSEARDTLLVVGVIALSLGVGFLISSIVSHRISIALGLHSRPLKPNAEANS